MPPTANDKPATIPATQSLRDLAGAFSTEITARDKRAIDACRQHLAPGTTVHVAWIPGDAPHAIVAALAALRRAGFDPVPHVAARQLESAAVLEDYVARARGEAGVDELLVIGGDAARPAGPFAASMDVLRSGVIERHDIAKVGIAGHPEGSPRIGPIELDAALREKAHFAAQSTARFHIVTQFCFEVDPILLWIEALRDAGIGLPVRVGLAGPASVATLVKFALRCGVGNSIRALNLRGAAIARLLAESDPGHLVVALRRFAASDPALGIAGFHFFPFGGIARLGAWLDG
ncbi:MAG TPA: methylenetetrahydrofolate reductase [Alphaproteobacteria bacterium]|nr:methylenetetrahydrofolate reductase [Alphaproteobacteria bacterium]